MSRRAIVAPAAVAAALAIVYLVWAPASQDLAAATFRAELFERDGFTDWNEAWYGGHHVLSYSVLYPPLAALIGVREAGAVAVVAAAALFAVLAQRRFGGRAAGIASVWFAAACAAWLLTGRMPFLLAVPFGLAAVLAADLRRPWWAAALAALCSLASPVAGLFAALAGAALFLADLRGSSYRAVAANVRSEGRRALLAPGRREPVAIVAGAALPILVLNLVSPVGGVEPFAFSAFIAIPLLAAVGLWLLPPKRRALRVGVALYALLALAVFVIPNPLGGNVTRLGALIAGPVALLALWPRGRWVVLAVCVPLLYWQLVAPVRDVRKASGDEAIERAFFEPLVEQLARVGPGRVHIPPTENRWEAAYVAPEHPLARGWLRQLESDDFDLFTDGRLDDAAYRDWLADHGVDYVALALDADLDYLAQDEAELIEGGLPYLEPVWRSEDWGLYRVR
jgi:hypothetical protein